MRTIKELLVLVRDRFEKIDCKGICTAKLNLFLEDKITTKEYMLISDYINKNAIKSRYKKDKNFWFPPYEKQPRIEWLDKHINLNNQ